MSLNSFRSLFQQASAEGSRSTVLKPLGWLIALCLAAILGSSWIEADAWIKKMLAVFLGLAILVYLGAYLYCLIFDRDALRSETYTIQKLAIEKGFVGDSNSGIFTIEGDQGGMRLSNSEGEDSSK